MGTLFMQCPVAAADKVIAAGKIKIGWITADIEALTARPLQCYRCLGKGHVREQCNSPIDRSGCCYNCGSPGHRAKDCSEKTRCVICVEAGLPANHRAGSEVCKIKKKGKGNVNNKSGGRRSERENKKGTSGSKGQSSLSPAVPATQEEAPKPQRTQRPKRASQKKKEEAASAKISQKGEEAMEVTVEGV